VRRWTFISCLFLLAVPASAQDTRYGFAIGLAFPQADTNQLVDHKLGYAVGGQIALPLGDGHVLRPRLDLSVVTRNTDQGSSLSVTTGCVGADYNRFVSGRANEGFYLLVGLGYAVTTLSHTDLRFSPYNNLQSSQDQNAIALAAGLGYQFNRTYGADLRYTTTKPGSFKNDAVNLSMVFQF